VRRRRPSQAPRSLSVLARRSGALGAGCGVPAARSRRCCGTRWSPCQGSGARACCPRAA
jgi:hypothetical protein